MSEGEGQRSVLQPMYDALDALRTQNREQDKDASARDQRIAVLEEKAEGFKDRMATAERQIDTLWKRYGESRAATAKEFGANEVKWSIVGTIAGAVLMFLLKEYFGS